MTVTIRFAEESDQNYLIEWLLQPGVLEGFPLSGLQEIEHASRIWMSYMKYSGVLTALCDGVPCGVANLYLQPYKKLSHQCLFMIILDEKFRGRGIGTRLIHELMTLAKDRFHIELLHLEVYEGNPAIRLYQRLGFEQYGVQKHFMKDEKGNYYQAKILMQKVL